MAALTDERIATLLEPYLIGASPDLCSKLSTYLDLLLRWNARTNLTSIRDPEDIVRRHFGESLFTASQLPAVATLLDFGSGAGFPGLPIQLLLPELVVTLAESQGKKASFLREAVRVLGLKTEVWAGRVEAMPRDRKYSIVALRAVDDMDAALAEAVRRLLPGGSLAILGGRELASDHAAERPVKMPGAADTFLYFRPF